jgi:small subunit ribosomal protein S6
MREYEFTFVVQPEISEEGLTGVCEKFEDVLAKQNATKLFYEDWGRRRLAYEIKKFQKGHYLVLHYLNDGQAVPEVERTARLDDSILRFLTVLADDEVKDIEARQAEAVGFEDERVKKAAERAERDAEEAAARAAEAEAAAEAARAAALAGPAAAAAGAAEAAGDGEAAETPVAATEDAAASEKAPAADAKPASEEAPAAEAEPASEAAPAEDAEASTEETS